MKLDKFYTNPNVTNNLIKEIDYNLKSAGLNPLDFLWIEPSAGSGNFLFALKNTYFKIKYKAFDIDNNISNNNEIIKQDFLNLKMSFSNKNLIFGNPPFGKRSKLAIDFINKSFEISSIICFILPNQFKRYLTQKKINNDLKLIFEKKISKNAFLVNNKPYHVNCVFQIWVSKKRKEFKDFKDKRLYKKEPNKINDLKTFIYNNTEQTLKFFDKKKYKWNIAVHRQGYYDYSLLVRNENELKKKRQYMFIVFKNNIAEKIIEKIDFKKLSKSNTLTPGFSTTDFIKEYKKNKKIIL